MAEAPPATQPTQPPGLPSRSSNDGKKKVVAALLLVVLLIAIVTQPETEETAPTTVAGTSLKVTGGVSVAPPQTSRCGEDCDFSLVRPLSRMSLGEVARSSIFEPEPEQIRRVSAGEMRVQAVYGSASSHSALVSGKIIDPGQPLPDGRTVIAVTDDGIVVGSGSP